MNIDLNTLGTLASIISLILAIFFWKLASKQAKLAEKQAEKANSTLNELKDKMMSWQNDINNSTINLIEARPEVIAQKATLEEVANNSAFMNRIADMIETLVKEADEKSMGYKMAIVSQLLNHQKSSITEREQIKANTILSQQGRKAE